MNNQELFDKVARHLIQQGAFSYDQKTETCMYRGPNGLKCAIGALIPDEKYKDEFECVGLAPSAYDNKNMVRGRILEAAGLASNQRDLAIDLQQCHDTPALEGSGIETTIEMLRSVAARYELNPAILGES